MSEVIERLLKVTHAGGVFRDDLLTDGSVEEWQCDAPDDRWGGRWSKQAGRTRIEIGGNFLLSRATSATATESDTWGEENRAFLLSVSDEMPVLGTAQSFSMVKSGRSDRVYFTTLMPDGRVEEFDLIEGVESTRWEGQWWTEGAQLVIAVGDYTWRAQRSGSEWAGQETWDAGESWLVGCLVRNGVTEVRGGLLSRTALFIFNGYTFHDTSRRLGGHFSNVLEVKKFSGAREMSFAAKIVRTGMTVFRNRELDYLDQFSATDGLIAAIDSFDLPSSDEYGEHRDGHVIILEWGDTDAKRTIVHYGAMTSVEVSLLVADVSRALAAMHNKFHAVHADVKIDNIIGRRTGAMTSWRLADFNVTSDIDLDSGHATFLGTTAICISPELHERMSDRRPYLVPSDDIWALGVVATQAIIGKVFPTGARIVRSELLDLLGGVNPLVIGLIAECLRPAEHRASALELQVRALALASQLVSGGPLSATDVESAVTMRESDLAEAPTVAETSAESNETISDEMLSVHDVPEPVPSSVETAQSIRDPTSVVRGSDARLSLAGDQLQFDGVKALAQERSALFAEIAQSILNAISAVRGNEARLSLAEDQRQFDRVKDLAEERSALFVEIPQPTRNAISVVRASGARLSLADDQRQFDRDKALAEERSALFDALAEERSALLDALAEKRSALFVRAASLRSAIVDDLISVIRFEAPSVQIEVVDGGTIIRFGAATIRVGALVSSDSDARSKDFKVDLDVIASTEFSITQAPDASVHRGPYEGRSHSLFFCDFEVAGKYEWYELAFFEPRGGHPVLTPFSLPPGNESAVALLSPFGRFQLARPVVIVPAGNLDEFIDRWITYFHLAHNRALRFPSPLPEGKVQFPWRKVTSP